jgi:hypothetical protein
MQQCNIGVEQRRVIDGQEGNVPVQFEKFSIFPGAYCSGLSGIPIL